MIVRNQSFTVVLRNGVTTGAVIRINLSNTAFDWSAKNIPKLKCGLEYIEELIHGRS